MQKATLVFVSEDDHFSHLEAILTEYDMVHIGVAGQYMNTLIETRTAMIFVDGRHPDWERFTTAPKISAATRRIPLVLVTDDAEQRATATVAGADRVLAWGELDQAIKALIDDLARVPDAQWLEQLDCECEEPLPPLAVEGVEKFNAGEYYPQHDLFEEQWVHTESPVRDLYRAILQVGVAYFQIERGNYRGALKMLQRSVQWLAVLPDVCQTIDVAQLRRDSYAVRAELERLGAERLDEFDRSLMKPVKRVFPSSSSGE